MVVLIVALMFIVLITISYFVSLKIRKPADASAPAIGQSIPLTPATYYHPAHTFAKVIGNDLVHIGMDDFAKQAFGDSGEIELPRVGCILKQGEVAWKTSIGDRKVSQPMPLTGTIIEVNEDKSDSSWLLKVEPLSLQQNLANLISESLAGSWMSAVRAKFQSSFSSSLVPVMQDGGQLVDGFSKHLENDQWEEFCKDFFNSDECS